MSLRDEELQRLRESLAHLNSQVLNSLVDEVTLGRTREAEQSSKLCQAYKECDSRAVEISHLRMKLKEAGLGEDLEAWRHRKLSEERLREQIAALEKTLKAAAEREVGFQEQIKCQASYIKSYQMDVDTLETRLEARLEEPRAWANGYRAAIHHVDTVLNGGLIEPPFDDSWATVSRRLVDMAAKAKLPILCEKNHYPWPRDAIDL